MYQFWGNGGLEITEHREGSVLLLQCFSSFLVWGVEIRYTRREKDVRGDSDAEGRGLFEAQVGGDLDLEISPGGVVFCEGAVFGVEDVASVDEARYAVSLLEGPGHLASYFLDDAGVVWELGVVSF